MVLGVISVALAIVALADVTCTWTGDGYVCSGEGGSVTIIGGSSGGGSQEPPVVTNGVGVCTNCSAIAPAELLELANYLEFEAGLILDDCSSVKDSIATLIAQNNELLDEIVTYQTWTTPSVSTNYAFSANNRQALGMRSVYQNTSQTGNTRNHQVMGAGNGIYYYANSYVKPHLQDSNSSLQSNLSYVEDIEDCTGYIMNDIVPPLKAGAVACQSAGGGGEGSGSGGGSVTNVTTGNWCTYDQGEALKRLLGEISNEVFRVRLNSTAISNFTEQCAYNIRTGLFTDYNAIPDSSGLGDTWQRVYLDGAETNWGYQPTNILARIELLLYGMTGVGTNQSTYTEGELNDTSVMEDIADNISDNNAQLRAIDTDADGQAATSLGAALTRFIGAFTPQSSALQANDEVVPSVSYRVGTKEYYVPSINVGNATLSLHNSFQSICATLFGVIYAVGCAWCIFLYWRWFAEKAVLMSKWAVELITSLFAS